MRQFRERSPRRKKIKALMGKRYQLVKKWSEGKISKERARVKLKTLNKSIEIAIFLFFGVRKTHRPMLIRSHLTKASRKHLFGHKLSREAKSTP